MFFGVFFLVLVYSQHIQCMGESWQIDAAKARFNTWKSILQTVNARWFLVDAFALMLVSWVRIVCLPHAVHPRQLIQNDQACITT